MANASRKRNTKVEIGDANQLHFTLEWISDNGTEGKISAYLGDEIIWGGHEGFIWSLGDVLFFLTKSIESLRFRQSLPFALLGISPFQIKDDLEHRWGPPSKPQEELWYEFEEKHNLARAFQGAHPRPVYLLREGNLFRIWLGSDSYIYPYTDTIRTLIALGDTIYERAHHDENLMKIYPEIHSWDSASKGSPKNLASTLAFSVNLELDELKFLTKGKDEQKYLEVGEHLDSEIMAAARMTSDLLTLDAISDLITKVRAVGHHKPAASLDKLSEKAAQILEGHVLDKPYIQGYVLAKWFSSQTLPRDNGNLVFDSIIRSWNVVIKEVTCNESLDAIAVWGPKHGPAILLNREGEHNRKEGRRSTLAHEICHLLVDRRSSIPFGEVLGGTVPYLIEARANAFAAELILPQDAAIQQWLVLRKKGFEAKDCVEAIKSKYQATIHITAHQLVNSGELDKNDRRELTSYFSNVKDSYFFRR
jgi:Zn-dependent peptidase ImmA (M78 family)